jgi:hypothetical protein
VVANSLFITGNRKEDNADVDQETGSSKKEWTRGLPESIYTYRGYISSVKATCRL